MENTFTEWLNNEFPFLKLIDVKYNKSEIKIYFTFIFSDKIDLDDDLKFKIENAILKKLNLKVKIDITYHKCAFDKDVIINFIQDFNNKFPMINLLDGNNYKIIEKENSILIRLTLSKVDYDFATKVDIPVNLKKDLEDTYFDKYEVELELSDVDTHNEEVVNMEVKPFEPVKINYYKVENLEPIYGKNLIENVTAIHTLKSGMTSVCIAGKISFFNKREYTKTKEKDGVEISEQKYRYNFSVKDFDGRINCVLFPNKNNSELCEKLEDGKEVILLCDIDDFNDKLSVRVKEFGFCKIPNIDIEEDIEYRDEFESYIALSPSPYIEENQINLFNNNVETIPTYLENKTFVVFDIETTGLDYRKDEIIEIGAVKIVNGEIIESFATLIKPNQIISEEITNINGITNEMVADAPIFGNVIADFYKFTRGSILVAHNAEFDTTFIKEHGKKYRFKFDNEIIDTLALSRTYLKQLRHHKLKNLCEYFGVSLINAHRALNDTVATAKCFIKMANLIK